jgi:hypothetical protein
LNGDAFGCANQGDAAEEQGTNPDAGHVEIVAPGGADSHEIVPCLPSIPRAEELLTAVRAQRAAAYEYVSGIGRTVDNFNG